MRPLAILPSLASLTEFLCMPSGLLHTPPSHLHQGGCTLPSHPSAISICLPHVLSTTLHSPWAMSSAFILSVEKLQPKNKLNQRSEKVQKEAKMIRGDQTIIL